MKDALGERVTEVRVSARLDRVPVLPDAPARRHERAMRRILAAAGRDEMPASKPDTRAEHDSPAGEVTWRAGRARTSSELAQLLYDQAPADRTGQLANPGDYARRLNRLLLKLLA